MRDVELREMRSEIGFVPQDPFLFSMTVGQNLRFGLDALEYDETIAAPAPRLGPAQRRRHARRSPRTKRIARQSRSRDSHPDIEAFKDGLDTLVGERGVTLSGGQKQRITLARALLVDPRILILDDALSSVDTKTEEVILDGLDEIMKNRTSIILTRIASAA